MNVILDKNGNVIQRSANLRGIRRYVSNNLIKVMSISPIGEMKHPDGKLLILFQDGSSFETNFASYNVLCRFVLNWRNTYGAPLLIGTREVGKNNYDNPELLKEIQRLENPA